MLILILLPIQPRLGLCRTHEPGKGYPLQKATLTKVLIFGFFPSDFSTELIPPPDLELSPPDKPLPLANPDVITGELKPLLSDDSARACPLAFSNPESSVFVLEAIN